MVRIPTFDVMSKNPSVKKKWTSKNLISVNAFGLGKGQAFFGI
jgi:hypothetical protein